MSDEHNFAAILNAITALGQKVDANHADNRAELQRHMKDEEGKIEEIGRKSLLRAQEAEERHAELLKAIQAINVVEALPKTEDGKPDVHGHRNDHEIRKAAGETWRRRYDAVVMAVMVSATVGGLAWAGKLIWFGAVQGPKP